jgi:hypothetical protein
MDSEKVLKANEAIRQLLDKYPYGFLPNPAARQEAERETKIIRESGPNSCIEILHSLADWLDRLFVPEKHETDPNQVKAVQSFVLHDLSRIEAEVNKQSATKA